MKTIQKSVLATLLSLVALVGGSSEAAAITVGGYSGRADSASQRTSFAESWNSVVYTGSGTARWDIPLFNGQESTGSPVVAVVYASGNTSNISCTVQAVDETQSHFQTFAWYGPNQPSTWTTVTLPTPAWGLYGPPANGDFWNMEVACFIGNNSYVQSVSF